MADIVVRVGGRSEQGVRPNNEDCYVMDREHNVFLVADGMGGQDLGEQGRAVQLPAQPADDGGIMQGKRPVSRHSSIVPAGPQSRSGHSLVRPEPHTRSTTSDTR